MSGLHQLDRILLLLPKLRPGLPRRIDELASEMQVSEAQLRRDLTMVSRREHPEPAGFVEAISITIDDTHVTLDRPSHFRRPTQLTAREAQALELGISIMLAELHPSSADTAIGIRDKLRAIAMTTAGLEEPTVVVRFDDSGASTAGIRALLGACAARRRIARIAYQRPQDAQAAYRSVGPLGLACINGLWYLFARDGSEGPVKQYRLDRIVGAGRTDESFVSPDGFNLEEYLGDGRPFVGRASDEAHIRYTGVAARLVAEDDGLVLAPDGSLTVAYPLADEEWAIRQALKYGVESELLSPQALRTRIAERLQALDRSS